MNLWVSAVLWLACAVGKWLVLVKTPEADIRIDQSLIWPAIGLVTLRALARTLKGWWSVGRHDR